MNWNDEKRAELRRLAGTGMFASDIAAILGTTKPAVLTVCGRNSISVNMHSDADLADMRARARLREKRKRQKRAAANPNAVTVQVRLGTSKTAPIYRNQLPRLPEMSKNALRAMLTEAVRNTGAPA